MRTSKAPHVEIHMVQPENRRRLQEDLGRLYLRTIREGLEQCALTPEQKRQVLDRLIQNSRGGVD